MRHPLLWVPSLYVAMGLPNIVVSVVAAIMFKNLGYSNETIALYTSQMYLPWVLKPLWAPFLELRGSKRCWVISMEFAMVASIGAVAFALPLQGMFKLSLAFFWITGFASATQDVAADAVYITSLGTREQARYAGVQGMCWNCGAVIASGVLVSLTGYLHHRLQLDWIRAWTVVMGLLAFVMAGVALWHVRVLPHGEPSRMRGRSMGDAFRSLGATWGSFFRKPRIWTMLGVVFFFRFGEGFIEKLGPLFLLDGRDVGGLALGNEALGHINGTLGTIGFIGGALVGGLLAARLTLRRSFVILALALNVPHLTYFLLSTWMPDSLGAVAALVTVEKFGFGVGSVGHILYMMQQLAPGDYRMSHYAFATGVMALAKWFTGSLSGLVYAALDHNYRSFFVFVLVASIPSVVLAFLAPFPHDASAPTRDSE